MDPTITFLFGVALGLGGGLFANSDRHSSPHKSGIARVESPVWMAMYCYQVAFRADEIKCKTDYVNKLGYEDALAHVGGILAGPLTHFGVEVTSSEDSPTAPAGAPRIGTLGRRKHNIIKRARIDQKSAGDYKVLEICFVSFKELDTTTNVLNGQLDALLCREVPLFGVFPTEGGMTEAMLEREFPQLKRLVES